MSERAVDWFASLRGVRPRMPWTLLAVLTVSAGLPLMVNNAPASWRFHPTGSVARILCVERLILPLVHEPHVVILGSSRTAFGVNPTELEKALGLDAGSAVNAGLIGGDLNMAVELYRRNRDTFCRAQLVVVNVDDWQLNSGRSEGNNKPLRAYYKMREHLTTMRDHALAALDWAKPIEMNVAVDDDGQMWFTPYDDRHLLWTPEICRSIVDDYYMQFATGPEAVLPLVELESMVRADGARLVVMQMPNAPNYHAELLRLQGDNYRRQLDELRRFAAEHDVPFLNFDSAAACELEPEDYSDGVHLRRQGARKFARHLANQLSPLVPRLRLAAP